jgi:hypothetical protein
MKKISMLFLCVILSVMITSCGSKSDSGSGESTALTDDEIDTINTTMMAAINSADVSSTNSSQDATDLTRSTAMGAITYALSCNTSNHRFTATFNETESCETDGHINISGNLKSSCTAWTYFTDPMVYCVCNGDWNTRNEFKFEFGDRTNNLNDCEDSGIILDGILYVDAWGTGTAINMSVDGTLSVNRRGVTGGLSPIDSCFYFLRWTASTRRWSGSICGRSVY